jgi:hypothetical protein
MPIGLNERFCCEILSDFTRIKAHFITQRTRREDVTLIYNERRSKKIDHTDIQNMTVRWMILLLERFNSGISGYQVVENVEANA